MGDTISDGLDRRELLRRGAALGAALAIATPAVQGLGRVSAFAQTSPPPGPVEASFPSHFQIIFTVSGSSTFYGIKWDGAWGRIGGPPDGAGSRCWDPKSYRGAGYKDATRDQMNIFGGKTSVTTETNQAGDKGAYVLDIAELANVGVSIVDAATFDGQYSGGLSGKCQLSVTPSGDGRYRFWKP